MSFRRPKIPRPSIPKIKKPTRSSRKKLDKTIKSVIKKKSNSKPKRKNQSLPKPAKVVPKKKIRKRMGICYSNKNCKGKILSRKCSQTECKKMGGKSWKGLSGCKETS